MPVGLNHILPAVLYNRPSGSGHGGQDILAVTSKVHRTYWDGKVGVNLNPGFIIVSCNNYILTHGLPATNSISMSRQQVPIWCRMAFAFGTALIKHRLQPADRHIARCQSTRIATRRCQEQAKVREHRVNKGFGRYSRNWPASSSNSTVPKHLQPVPCCAQHTA
jgi:hypothetical protein